MVPGSSEAAVRTAERILDVIRCKPISDLPITVSMGIAEYTLDLDKTMKRADEATYKAKQAGKDTYVVYEASREQT
jgi:PleD family two-component response regulator